MGRIVDLLKAVWILLRAGCRLIIRLVAALFHPRAHVVRFKSIYDLAISEISKTLKEPPPPGVTLSDKMTDLLRYLPEATAILETPSDSAFAIENPIQAMTYFTASLEGGINRKGQTPARVVRAVNEFITNDTISDAQKEEIFKFAMVF